MHKERIALREGKPLTTDFQFLKSSQTRRLLSNRPFFLRLSSATSPCNVRQLLHAPNRAAAPGEGSCPHCPGITAPQQLSAAREGSCGGWMAQHCEGWKDGRMPLPWGRRFPYPQPLQCDGLSSEHCCLQHRGVGEAQPSRSALGG